MKKQCPWCKKVDCVDGRAYENARHYGSNVFKLFCMSCGKPIRAVLERRVVNTLIEKGDHENGDFGRGF